MALSNDELDKRIDFLESQIPMLSQSAIEIAYARALHSGHSVLESSKSGNIYEIFPDGSKKLYKKTPPYISVKMGEKIILS